MASHLLLKESLNFKTRGKITWVPQVLHLLTQDVIYANGMTFQLYLRTKGCSFLPYKYHVSSFPIMCFLLWLVGIPPLHQLFSSEWSRFWKKKLIFSKTLLNIYRIFDQSMLERMNLLQFQPLGIMNKLPNLRVRILPTKIKMTIYLKKTSDNLKKIVTCSSYSWVPKNIVDF